MCAQIWGTSQDLFTRMVVKRKDRFTQGFLKLPMALIKTTPPTRKSRERNIRLQLTPETFFSPEPHYCYWFPFHIYNGSIFFLPDFFRLASTTESVNLQIHFGSNQTNRHSFLLQKSCSFSSIVMSLPGGGVHFIFY